ncbi:helicase SNF2 [Parazoarcus communis]|uniref:Helicase SNF2 n=1 Tax=Parazoarcus communis TaxID=41977 RepID=A0A2U8H8Z2_9RHOO|nr:DEAD/DEAH box helicase [Parazoarcus communis]AWI82060.1 helicase SNF2 [Parazoarcus communis]
MDNGLTLVIRFVHGIEEVPVSSIEDRLSPEDALTSGEFSSGTETISRIQASAITSLNDSWGVFSRSRISLLPHQLWVCHRALRKWPVRLMIADDVGLGKTVEAGLILWPLISRGTARRILILTPASLVEQWQYRMRQMFDIRLSIYQPDLDSGKRDFWNIHQQVVASLPTLRLDRNDRHERLLDAPAWDMVIVDEAHHLHADEATGKTLGFQLIEKMQKMGKITSCVLFTATPHRGKDFGFWSLMSLVDDDTFGPSKPRTSMLSKLPNRLIRNCKQKVVDMQGAPLFQPILQFPETFEYSPEETQFYETMTAFISSGKAYASTLSSQGRGQVMLVLIALQKLASSSVAAVRGALRTRLARIQDRASNLRMEADEFVREDDGTDDNDILKRWILDDQKNSLKLMEDEILHLNRLIEAAEHVVVESRIQRVIEIIEERFADESVLLFTEYKATQALVLSALMKRFGEKSVGFINGDGRLREVLFPDGKINSLSMARDLTGDAFNSGAIRFLVSTEAGGEGIDLQVRCHSLIHVDLPWNPMRLHQRVGRVNRFGQRHQVQVASLRNPDTVESLIWSKLEEKLNNIMRALGAAMDEPEDLLQLVLGMTEQKVFDELFQEAKDAPREGFDKWFDQKTQNFGGAEAIDTVISLLGHADGFDLSGLKNVPTADLPDLEPFFLSMLKQNGRRPEVTSEGLTFLTPDAWRNSPAILRKYERSVFRRDVEGKDAQARILGVGHPVIDQALRQAKGFPAKVALVPALNNVLAVFEVFDRVTTGQGQVKRVLIGVEDSPLKPALLNDSEVLSFLNSLEARSTDSAVQPTESAAIDQAHHFIQIGLDLVRSHIAAMKLPFDAPEVECLAVLVPAAP